MSETNVVLPDILLLSESQALNAVDKKVIREAGAGQIETMTSGEGAARRLAEDLSLAGQIIVVVNERLSDMSGEQFCDIIRLHPRLLALPVLLVLPSDSDLDQLVTLGCGASALIARPYSVEAMRTALIKLTYAPAPLNLLKEGKKLSDTRQFDACLENFRLVLRPNRHQPEDFFKVGMQCLEQKKWNSAIMAFHHALSSQLIKGEAELGMSAAYKGKGETREAEHWLGRAAETFVSAGRWHLARTVYAKLVASNAQARNPFFMQARRQIGQGEYDAAAVTLTEGLNTVPHNVVSEKMAELCALARSPETMLSYLEEALQKRREDDTLIRSSLAKEFALKLKEQQARKSKASEQRTEDLSRRLGLRNREQESELPPDQEKEEEETASDGACESRSEEIRRPAATRETALPDAVQEQRKKPRIGIATRSEENFLSGLVSLPGDNQHELANKKTYALPRFSRSGLTHLPYLHEIVDIVRLTWQSVRRSRTRSQANDEK